MKTIQINLLKGPSDKSIITVQLPDDIQGGQVFQVAGEPYILLPGPCLDAQLTAGKPLSHVCASAQWAPPDHLVALQELCRKLKERRN